jgi:hypothetical protein
MAVSLDTVPDVVARMRQLDTTLPADDGVAVFNRLYLDMTLLIEARLQDGFFRDPAFMERLGVVFAGLFLRAVDAGEAGRPVPKAWAPLVADRTTPGIMPVQYAFAGINAHINHDLAVAVVQTCEERGLDPDDGPVHDDYERVNGLIAQIEAGIRRSFLSEAGREVDDRVGPVVHLVSAFSIDKARDAAWVTTQTIWALRRVERLHRDYLATLARSVGLAGRTLLTPCLA